MVGQKSSAGWLFNDGKWLEEPTSVNGVAGTDDAEGWQRGRSDRSHFRGKGCPIRRRAGITENRNSTKHCEEQHITPPYISKKALAATMPVAQGFQETIREDRVSRSLISISDAHLFPCRQSSQPTRSTWTSLTGARRRRIPETSGMRREVKMEEVG